MRLPHVDYSHLGRRRPERAKAWWIRQTQQTPHATIMGRWVYRAAPIDGREKKSSRGPDGNNNRGQKHGKAGRPSRKVLNGPVNALWGGHWGETP